MKYSEIPMDEWIAGAGEFPDVGEVLSREQCRDLAGRIAYLGAGGVSPNPLVGAVIVDGEHRFLGAGAHLKFGDGHAEVNAIAHAKKLNPDIENIFDQATIYVTLEPCAHTGNTPPCAQAIVDHGFARVVYGARDPNPAVDGRGVKILEEAGIEVELDSKWGDACGRVAEVFFHGALKETPFVGLKAAQSLDGSIGRSGDQRAFITGERARQYGHFLRVYYDAILVGRGTVVLDNPSLDPRDSLVKGEASWRIVLDPQLTALRARPIEESKLLSGNSSGDVSKVIWVVGPKMADDPLVKKVQGLGAVCLFIETESGEFKLDSLMTALFDLGVRSVLLEGGSGVYRPWLAEGLVNRMHLFIAPKLMLGSDKIPMTQGQDSPLTMDLKNTALTTLGSDMLVEGDF